ncbi:methionyl-tRNA formyltransferase [Mesotoga sp. H07.pep.5.3]|uniref:methionyl-tRNA formyltransferase n=1 Tax=Mesotoga sp. H07.pep.5.3 TaxID=1421003 RepID=UPI000C1A66BA|nr:methionyl-tRNA formyltransferase [Mesotoga sp. H07.pep.5.3]PIJ63013.1 methionyl-tRNA formyltransferase [Mesotoga sp. H07.pep.5.3]
MSESRNIIVATVKPWNIENAQLLKKKYCGKFNIHIITTKDEFKPQVFAEYEPLFTFFPHWSWKIPREIYEEYECVVFHSTDLPFGRGGSPIQNLISRGIFETKISALKVVEEIDAGPVYLKEPVSLYGSTAEEIFIRISNTIFRRMIPRIIEETTVLEKQSGPATFFRRLKPADSLIDESLSLEQIFHKIRMLDAKGYPKAFIELDNVILEFSRAAFYSDGVRADVLITKKERKT